MLPRSASKCRRRAAAPTCRYFARGFCARGSQCRFSHAHSSSSSSSGGASESVKGNEKKSDSAAGRVTNEHEIGCCGICFEEFREGQGFRVGLMESCDHHFCYKCILKWRGHNQTDTEITKETQRACPMCRTTSHFVVPSARPLVGRDRKAEIKSFKKKCRSKPCRNWVPDPQDNHKKYVFNRSCKLGHLCFYAHQTLDGKNAKPAQKRAHKKETKRREFLQRRRRMRTSGRASPAVMEAEADADDPMMTAMLLAAMQQQGAISQEIMEDFFGETMSMLASAIASGGPLFPHQEAHEWSDDDSDFGEYRGVPLFLPSFSHNFGEEDY